MSLKIPSVLAIAGSDSGGGAGIQADLKTITVLGLYGSSVITAVTAQNTRGVQMSEPVSPALLAAQLNSVLSDLPPQAVKIGMLGTADAVRIIAEMLTEYPSHSGRKCPIVLDPVMLSTSGRRLLDPDGVEEMKARLFPAAALITPNLPEACALLNQTEIRDQAEMEKAAFRLSETYETAVLLKGGHLHPQQALSLPSDEAACTDILCENGRITRFSQKLLITHNNHGTGCTLSSAIACGLACGCSMEDSIQKARRYLHGALSADLDLGSGNGPLHHGWQLMSRQTGGS